MIYLKSMQFPGEEEETDFTFGIKATCYDTIYPFGILSKHGLRELEFEPVTILYGGNGSGKTTALNVIAETLSLKRGTLYNRSNFFGEYVKRCSAELSEQIPSESRIITSDDVFDFMLNLRSLNQQVDIRREKLYDEYQEIRRGNGFRMRSLADYEELKKQNSAKSKTYSKFVRQQVPDNVREHSNGESALLYFQEKIQENALYLLDEPENSLSPEKQQELLKFLEESARFFNCQFIMATHSPFLLSMRGARIYDLDENPVDIKRWTQLGNVRAYYQFFEKHKGEFL